VANVLIVDDSNSSELPALLSEGGSSVTTCGAKGAVASARSSQPELIIVFSLGDASARFAAHLAQHLASACPPLLVVLPQRNDTLRDQCLIAGARDVSFEGGLEDVALKVDVLTQGWLRGTPKRPFVGLVRAQKGKQSLTLQAADIDPSGLGLASAGEVASGDLLRVALALPGGALVVWGRATECDGALGLRFVGLAAEDRVRLAGAIKGSGERAASSKTAPAIAPPVMAPQVVSTSAPVITPPPPPVAVEPAESPSTAAESSELVSAAPAVDPAAAPTSSDIGDLIGSALGMEVAPSGDTDGADAAANTGSGVDVQPAPVTPWPQKHYQHEACFNVLRDALTLGLVGEVEGAPVGQVVLDFTRSLTLPEQRAFDPEPPSSLPEQGLTIRCLELRMRLFASSRDAREDAAAGAGTFGIDSAVTAKFDAEVNAASNELQAAINVFIATSDTVRIKEMNQFRNSLLKSHADFKTALAVLRGEVTEQSGRAVLLDVAEQTLDQRRGSGAMPQVQPEPEKKSSEFKASAFKKELDPAKRRTRRLVSVLVVLLLLLGGAIWAIPQGARRLGPEELAQIGALDIVVTSDTQKATVTVPDTWKVTREQVEKTRVLLARFDVTTFVIQTVNHSAVAFVSPRRDPVLIPRAQPVAEKK
jgi:hypothetical protein